MKIEEPADSDTNPLHRERAASRMRFTKRMLRPLPRRATIHRWPVLKWFAKAARKTPYLWRFGVREVSRAIYLGSIISFLPIPGAQFAVAFLVALAVRANLPVIMGLQLITNVFTAWFIYLFTDRVGSWIIEFCNLTTSDSGLIRHSYNLTLGGIAVGFLFGFIADMIFRLFIVRRLNKPLNVKRMLKS